MISLPQQDIVSADDAVRILGGEEVEPEMYAENDVLVEFIDTERTEEQDSVSSFVRHGIIQSHGGETRDWVDDQTALKWGREGHELATWRLFDYVDDSMERKVAAYSVQSPVRSDPESQYGGMKLGSPLSLAEDDVEYDLESSEDVKSLEKEYGALRTFRSEF